MVRRHTGHDADPDPVRTPEDDSLPSIHPERYGAFETRNGETVLYDSDAKGAWIRADHSVTVGR
jgi:hypothetical protein